MENGGTATFTGCTISGNSANYGGGVANDGTLTLTACTLSGNSANYGGGVLNDRTATLTACTLSGNSASEGGGLDNNFGAVMTLTACTLSGNSASAGGGLANDTGPNFTSNVTIGDTIVAGNMAAIGPDVSGAVLTDQGYNLIGNNAGSSGFTGPNDQLGTITSPIDPLLAPLGDYGGPTQTMALLAGSPAIGKGAALGQTTDQRGQIRGDIVDIGAFQASLVVESAASTVDTTAAGLTLPGAVNLADQFAGTAISFDPAAFSSSQTISLTQGALELSDTALATSITGPAAGLTISGGASGVFRVDPGVNASLSGLALGGSGTGAGITDNGGLLIVTATSASGFSSGIAVSAGGAATVVDCTITGDATGIAVGSGSSDTATLTATNDSFAGDTTGVQDNQSAGSVDAMFDWWGSGTGPTSAVNTGGQGAKAIGNVAFSPWLGDANSVSPDSLVFLVTAGNSYVVSPNGGDTGLNVTLGGNSVGSIPGAGTLAFAGTGGTITIDGESGPGSTDVFTVGNTSVQFDAADGLEGSTINFPGSGLTRNVDAQGATNTFNIQSSGSGGTPGSLVGDSGPTAFVFAAAATLAGGIQGGGAGTLNYAAYTTGVKVNLGNGTNGTATNVNGTVTGITAVIGGSGNDTLNAGSVANVVLTGAAGTNSLSGNGASDSVVESLSSSYNLTNTKLTGAAASFVDNLSGISVAVLTGSSPTANTFTVTGWSGTGSLTAPAGTGTLTDSGGGSFTLTNPQLKAPNTTLALSGIVAANLTDSINGGGDTFTVTGWTGGGSLKGSSETLVDGVAAGATIANTSLAVPGGPTFTLGGFKTANLTDTTGGDALTVGGWTGGGSLADTGPAGDTVAASAAANFTLSSSALSSSDGMSLGLRGFTTANLTATASGKTFTVTGWTGGGLLTGTTTATATVSEPGGFTLSNTALSSPTGLTLDLSGITTANLTDTSAGGDTFTITGWTGGGSLSGSSETLADSFAAATTLTNASLAVTGLPKVTLGGFTKANLTDSSTAGGNTVTVTGWTGGGSLTDKGIAGDAVTDSGAGSFSLSNTELTAPNTMLALSGFTTANLTDSGAGGDTFTVTGWTGGGVLKGAAETIVDRAAGGFTLSNSALSSTAGGSLTLNGFKTATLQDTSAGGQVFTVTGWTGAGSLTGASDTVVDGASGNFALSNTSLSVGNQSLSLTGISTANLTDTGSGHTFTVAGWTGNGSLGTTTSGNSETLAATEPAGVTLTNTSMALAGGGTLSLGGFVKANLTATTTSGNPSSIIDASGFSNGPTNVTVNGGGNAIVYGGTAGKDTLTADGPGDDILIGDGAGDKLADSGTGMNILIGGGAGGDTLTGDGNDILVSGTTTYDGDTAASITALDAILAEWTSGDSYSTRIGKIFSGLGTGGTDALNSSTLTQDGKANTLQDGSTQSQNNNWFVGWSNDTVKKKAGEVETVL